MGWIPCSILRKLLHVLYVLFTSFVIAIRISLVAFKPNYNSSWLYFIAYHWRVTSQVCVWNHNTSFLLYDDIFKSSLYNK